jgi:hypothetical protein
MLSQYSVWLRTRRWGGGRGLDTRQMQKDFSSSLCGQTSSEARPMGTGGPFPGSKPRPRRDADRSPQSSAEVKNK